MTGSARLAALSVFAAFLQPAAAAAPAPADSVYRNGYIYTVDARDSVQQALAVRSGRIVYVGDDAGTGKLVGKATKVVDLHGRMLMPGLVDAHMHPQSGGSRLLNCSLDYEPLSVPQFQARIQACLDKDPRKDPDRWLLVVNWLQQGMQPEGVATSAALLDKLHTSRPVIVRSSFGHSVQLNSRGIALAGIQRDTPDPAGGKIIRDAAGDATGLLEDAAQDMAMNLLPPLTEAENLAASAKALRAMREQGITTFLDAYTDPETLTAFAALQRQGKLTARAHFAVLVDLDKGATPKSAVDGVLKLQRQFDQGATTVAPSMQVRHAKLFMDGVIAAPAFTGAMLAPYLVNQGTADKPDWQPGPSKGPASYFSMAALKTTLAELATAGIDPHIHVDGDRAVRESLDAIEALRATTAGRQVRPVLAHDEIVAPADYPRFASLDVTPVLSFQWGKPAPDTVGALKDYLGPARYATVEPQAVLLDAGARVAYGSDWPVDPLDVWFALKVGVTRTAAPDAGNQFAGRLTAQPGMPRAAVLRAVTMNAAYTLRQEAATGSLEVGKLADFVVLDRNFFTIPDEDIANVKVLQTVVGGKVVYQAASPPAADHHQHVFSPAAAFLLGTPVLTAQDVIGLLDLARIERAVLLSVAYTYGKPGRHVDDEAAKVRAENDWTAAQAALYPGRLIAFCSVNPLRDYALDEIARCAGEPGLAHGLKLHIGNSDVQLDKPEHLRRMRKVFEMANARRMAIVVHLRASISQQRPYGARQARILLEQLMPLARDIPVQVAHMAGSGPGYDDPAAEEVMAVLAEAVARRAPHTGNLWFDVASLATPDLPAAQAAQLVRRIRQVGPARILYGSDAAVGTTLRPREGWAAFRQLPLTEAEFAQIAGNLAPYFTGKGARKYAAPVRHRAHERD